MVEIDGGLHSGGGSVVRQAVAYAAVTGQPVRVVNVRARRPNPGLRHQHVRAVEAICQLVGGTVQGAVPDSRAFTFHPGTATPGGHHTWDIASAGSATMLALAMLPLLIVGAQPVQVELRGGLFQDFAPSVFHLQHALLLLARMGATVRAEMVRPGYVPSGGGVLRVEVVGARGPLLAERRGGVQRVWGIALAAHLARRRVSARMADAASRALAAAGPHAVIRQKDSHRCAMPRSPRSPRPEPSRSSPAPPPGSSRCSQWRTSATCSAPGCWSSTRCSSTPRGSAASTRRSSWAPSPRPAGCETWTSSRTTCGGRS
jgi:RNA 3'-phosphate cyclase